MAKFVPCVRDQPYLLPPDMRDWIPADDLAHFVIEAVELVDVSQFRVNERGTGSAQYEPRMMLALLIYCYAIGIFSSRRIERATWRDLGVRFVAANRHPDHDTIAKFRRENFAAVADCFLQVLLLAKELKLLRLGTVSVDGTKLKASASKHRSVTYERAGELAAQLELEIAELLRQAEAADREAVADPEALPQEIARREELQRQLLAARERLEAQARAKAEAEQAEYERKLAARRERGGSGRVPQPPSAEPAEQQQSNLTDPDSRLMRKNQRAEFEQAYNAQATVDAEGSQLIVGQGVSQSASDKGELMAGVTAIPAALGQPEAVLADNGYANGVEVERVKAAGVEPYVATGAEGRRRPHDFRPQTGQQPKEPKADWLREMADKLKTDAGKEQYRLRKQTVEPVFGIIKSVLGFRSFTLRGVDKVTGEWNLVALAYNCKRLHRLRLEQGV